MYIVTNPIWRDVLQSSWDVTTKRLRTSATSRARTIRQRSARNWPVPFRWLSDGTFAKFCWSSYSSRWSHPRRETAWTISWSSRCRMATRSIRFCAVSTADSTVRLWIHFVIWRANLWYISSSSVYIQVDRDYSHFLHLTAVSNSNEPKAFNIRITQVSGRETDHCRYAVMTLNARIDD